MRRHIPTIARFLLALLLLLQLGSAAAAFVPPVVSSECHDHAVVLGQSALAGHGGASSTCDDGGCVMHCAVAPVLTALVPPVMSASFIEATFPDFYFPAAPPDSLYRPPKAISC